jgi:serine/threonine protein kinase
VFSPGTVISHYRIIEKIGAGGMGVVYKAEDTRLKRTVALKCLPPRLICDAEAKERFEHEARAASALNHANITTIYEIDEVEGQCFIAMEYIEGKSIREIATEKSLSLPEILDISIQMAGGLNAAHERGVIHRDVKSANIMVTTKGRVKIMDFGLAKLRGVTRLTKTGTTLGTLQYMSPEQVQGKDVDNRSDLFSLGVVLYEMITGQ